MKMLLKRASAVALSAIASFAFVGCNANSQSSTYLDDSDTNSVSMEEVNEYLLANGYSKEFTVNTGIRTKYELYELKAVCEEEKEMAVSDVEDPIFESQFTVSDISTAHSSVKILTLNWHWTSDEKVKNDGVSIMCAENYEVLLSYIEFFGKGYKREGEKSLSAPASVVGTVAYREFGSVIDGEYGESSSYACGVRFGEVTASDLRFEKLFSNGEKAEYQIPLNDFRGSYSVMIARSLNGADRDISSAGATYYHWVGAFKVKYSFNFETRAVPTPLNVSYDQYEDTMHLINFYYPVGQ